jgi:hypothetical protein
MITALDSFLLQSQHDVSDSPVIIVITCVIIGSVVVSIILIFILVSVFILSVISVVILVILVSVIIVILVSVIIVVSIILILVSVVSIILIVILISVVRKEIKPVIVLGDVTIQSIPWVFIFSTNKFHWYGRLCRWLLGTQKLGSLQPFDGKIVKKLDLRFLWPDNLSDPLTTSCLLGYNRSNIKGFGLLGSHRGKKLLFSPVLEEIFWK